MTIPYFTSHFPPPVSVLVTHTYCLYISIREKETNIFHQVMNGSVILFLCFLYSLKCTLCTKSNFEMAYGWIIDILDFLIFIDFFVTFLGLRWEPSTKTLLLRHIHCVLSGVTALWSEVLPRFTMIPDSGWDCYTLR